MPITGNFQSPGPKEITVAPNGPSFPAVFREALEGETRGGLLTSNSEWPEEKEERLVHCRTCRMAVTSSANSILVNGRHHHTFPNPLGIVFEIGCFSAAGGCLHRGQSTGEYSWFPGYTWCFALCAGCRAHLGWHYTSPASNFYGLIMANLLVRD